MKKTLLMLCTGFCCLVGSGQDIMKPETVTETITRMGDLLVKNYVFIEKGEAMKKALNENLQNGGYFNRTLEQFASLVNQDLQSICPDKHMRVDVFPATPPANIDANGSNGGQRPRKINPFKKVEFLQGNIALVSLDNFPDPAFCDEYVISVMNSISSANTVIFDLRNNGGGSPKLVQLILSYFLEEGTLYNKVIDRIKNETTEYRTYHINSEFESTSDWRDNKRSGKLKDKLETNGLLKAGLYVLTAKRTFSAAEEFAYDIQSIKRGKIVGETSGGGAHQMNGFPVYGRIGMRIPYARPINPFTNTDWEGNGVTPDIAVKATDALKAAHFDALKLMISKATGPEEKSSLLWDLQLAEYYYKSTPPLSETELKKIIGKYGSDIAVFMEGSDLVAQIDAGGLRKFKLQQLDDNCFKIDENTIVSFSRDAGGNVIAAEAVMKDGRKEKREKVE
jgi:hypothetical protein